MIANLIGVGYWGSFIYKTLKDTGFKTINLCDPKVPGACTNYKKMDQAEFVFVATPVSSHFEICEHFPDKTGLRFKLQYLPIIME